MTNNKDFQRGRIRFLEAEVKQLREAIAKRDSMVEKMNTATVEFIDAYCGMEDYLLYNYLLYNEEVEA